MKIAIASQNFRTITGHAGRARRFFVYKVEDNNKFQALEPLDLPKEMSLHEYHGQAHPLFEMDVVIVGDCGTGFIQRMASHGVKAITTAETIPVKAVEDFLAGKLTPAAQTAHHHDGDHQP